tara:strand:+ start:1764 stop:2189 length:426 start_codon:yes stop_codon:yes gene_type:complete
MKIIESSDNPIEILKNDKKENSLSLYYFTASWCGPCKRIFPSLLDLENKLKEQYNKLEEETSSDESTDLSDTDSEDKINPLRKVVFYKIDINENDEYSDSLNIKSVPTFHLYDGEELLDQTTGANIQKIGELITNNIKIKK